MLTGKTDIETSGKETKVRLRWHEHWQARHSSKETEELQEVIYVPIRTFRVQQVRAESIDLLLSTPSRFPCTISLDRRKAASER